MPRKGKGSRKPKFICDVHEIGEPVMCGRPAVWRSQWSGAKFLYRCNKHHEAGHDWHIYGPCVKYA